jgi:ABC-2 type transport system ATP-binding protein
VIKVEHLVKSFGTKLAVDDVSFTVERGEVLGFLGPNGAGKSTTMRIITGFYPPTSGQVSVGGFDIVESPIPAKRLIGYLPENAPGYADMTVYGFLGFAAELRGLRGSAKKQAIHRAVDTCFLDSVLYQTIDTLSKGYKHRTCLAQSIIHDPDILVLDEPTDGLDPNQKHEVRGLIKRMGGEQSDRIFDAHSRRSGARVYPRDHHRPRQNRGCRHTRRAQRPLAARRRSPLYDAQRECRRAETKAFAACGAH